MGQTHSHPQILQLQNEQNSKAQFKVAVICGSLRKASTNSGLLKACYETKDQRFYFHWVEIIEFPVFNEDVESVGIPPCVQVAREIISKADAILFGVPEYNSSIAAPLKNAYDWISRQDKNKFSPFTEKLAAMVSSAGVQQGRNSQEHFRKCVQNRKINLMKPSKEAQILVNRWGGKFFDDSGTLIDADIKKRIGLFLNEFYNHIKGNKK